MREGQSGGGQEPEGGRRGQVVGRATKRGLQGEADGEEYKGTEGHRDTRRGGGR